MSLKLKKRLQSKSSIDMSDEQRNKFALKLTDFVRKSHIKGKPFNPESLTLLHVSPCDKGTIAVIATNTEDYVENVDTWTLRDNNGVLFAEVQAPVKHEIALRALFVKHYSGEIPVEVLRMMLGAFRLSNALVVLFRMTCPDWVGEGYDWHGPLPHEFSEEITKARKFYKS